MERLYFGAAYAPERARAGKDAALMVRAGFNLVDIVLSEGASPAGLRGALRAAEARGLEAVVSLPAGRDLKKFLEIAAAFPGVIGYRLAQEDQRGAVSALARPGQFAACLPDAASADGADIALYGAAARSRSVGRGYIAFGVPVCGERGELPSPGRIKLAALAHIACGAGGVVLSRWHSGRGVGGSYAPGVLGYDLAPGEIFGECACAAAEMNRLSEKVAGLQKRNRTALLLSRASRTLYDTLNGPGSYERTLRRFAGSLFRLNAEYDVLWDAAPDPGRYNLIAAPALCAASDDLLAALGAFVESGGRLLACGRMGFADETLTPRVRTRALSQLLGFTFSGLVDAGGVPLRSRKVRLPENASADGLMELLNLKTASILVTASHPERGELAAVTLQNFGRGRAAYFAADLAPAAMDQTLDFLLRAFYIPLPGIRWPLALHRARSRAGRDLIFFLNHSPVPQPLPYGGELPAWGAQVREDGRPV